MLLIQPYFKYEIFCLLSGHVLLIYVYICPYMRTQTKSSPFPGGRGRPGGRCRCPWCWTRELRPPKGCEGTLHSCSLFFMGCDSVVPMADSSLMDGTCQGCCEKPSPLLLCCLLDNLSLGMDVAIPFVICEMNREGCPEKEQEIGWNMQATSLELCVLW